MALSAKPLPPDRRKKPLPFAKAVGGFVPKLTSKVFEKYGFHSAEIMMEWARVAGADLARVTAPERIRWPRTAPADPENGRGTAATLVLRVEPAHALEVGYRTHEIIDRINRYFGYRAIADIKLLQAPLNRQTAVAGANRTQTPATTPTDAKSPVESPVDLAIPESATGDVAAALARLAGSVLTARRLR